MLTQVQYESTCTFVYFLCFVGLASQTSILGVTLSGLSISYGETLIPSNNTYTNQTIIGDATALSESLMGRGIGYYIGTMSIGFLFDRFANKAHVLFFLCCLTHCILTTMIPIYVSGSTTQVSNANGDNLGVGRWYLFLALLLQGIGGGAVDLGGNVLLTRLFAGDLEKLAPRMNLLHFGWGVGATIGPLLAVTLGLDSTSLITTYSVISLCALIISTPILCLRSPLMKTEKKTEIETQPTPTTTTTTTTSTSTSNNATVCSSTAVFKLLFLMMMYYFTYSGAERTMGDWVATFATIAPAKASVEQGAFLVSVYFGFMSIGRLITAMLTMKQSMSVLFTPARLITGNLLVAIFSYVLLLIFGSDSYTWMVISVAGVGLAFSSIYPSGISFAESKIAASGSQQSLYMSGAPLGGIVWPTLIGTLMRSQSVLYFPYVGAGLIFLCFVVFVFLYCSPRILESNVINESDNEDINVEMI